jgi:DNA-binding transcriptional ArsR family regulator
VARALTNIKLRGPSLRRLSVAFADPLRLKIITELYLREMSPTEFFDAFGGGSVPRVNRHFKTLAKHGWLTLVGTKTGGRRRGAQENFYRATELAVVDLEAWATLPESVRLAFTGRTYKQFAERAKDAISADTFDARSDRHLTWTPLALDRHGWDRIIRALDAIFEALLEEQARAGLRIAKSGEKPILTTVGLAGFESPAQATEGARGSDGADPTVSGVEGAGSSGVPIELRLSKVFANSLDLKIVSELNQQVMSPKQFFLEFGGGSLTRVSRHFKYLETYEWLEMVRTATGGRRRGAVEHFYRATEPAIFDIATWSAMPISSRSKFSWRTFQQLCEQIAEAIAQRTIDSRVDRHFTWSLLRLDQQGWDWLVSALDALFDSLPEEREKAQARMEKSGEEPIRMIVAMAAFESPKDTTKAP